MKLLVTSPVFVERDHIRRAVEVRNSPLEMMECGVIDRSNRPPATRGLADPLIMFKAPQFVCWLRIRPPLLVRLLPVTDFLDDSFRRAAKKVCVLLREQNKRLSNRSPLLTRQAGT